MGVGKGILKILAKKVSFEWEKTNFATFGPPKKIWKISLMPPPGTNPSDAHACARIIVYFETEIKRTERNKQFVTSESTKVTKKLKRVRSLTILYQVPQTRPAHLLCLQ